MRYRITHTTTYTSDQRVSICHNAAWLRPRDSSSQKCTLHRLKIDPLPSCFSERTDAFGNRVTHFSFNEGYRILRVQAASRVTVTRVAAPEFRTSGNWEELVAGLLAAQSLEATEATQFVFDSPRIRRSETLAAYAAPSFRPGRPILEGLAELTARIHADFQYDCRATTVSTPLDEVMEQRRGVCQDFAHLEIGMLRSLGIPARYVSGYVRTYPAAGETRLVGADASHAWLSVFCGPLGWVDVDPTNNKFPTDEHVTLAWGRDYSDVSPLKGVFVGGGRHTLTVAVDVVPVTARS